MNAQQGSASSAEIRPFHVEVPEAEVADMRRRIKDTRLPEKDCTQP